jgi:hypothetical protein
LHFLGKATLHSVLQSTNQRGGIRRATFRINSEGTPVPFFTVPTADRYGIVRMTRISGITWDIELIRSGYSDVLPEVYIFTEVTSQHVAYGSWGMKVVNETDGRATYDSRLKPLIIRGGTEVIPPINPMSTYPNAELNAESCLTNASELFIANQTNYTPVYNTNVSKLIVSYQSVAQTMRQIDKVRTKYKCFGASFNGNCIGFGDYTYYYSWYWNFWRAGISAYQSGTTTNIDTGWITINWGCRSDIKEINKFFGIRYDTDSSSAGEWPLTNASINMGPVPVMISDGALYD